MWHLCKAAADSSCAQTLDVLEDWLTARSIGYQRIDGSVGEHASLPACSADTWWTCEGTDVGQSSARCCHLSCSSSDYVAIPAQGAEASPCPAGSQERQSCIDCFNQQRNEAYPVFLLSTRAGGQGINLATADTVRTFTAASELQPACQLLCQHGTATGMSF